MCIHMYIYIYTHNINDITIDNNRAIIFRAHVTNFSSGAGPPGEQVRLCEAGCGSGTAVAVPLSYGDHRI